MGVQSQTAGDNTAPASVIAARLVFGWKVGLAAGIAAGLVAGTAAQAGVQAKADGVGGVPAPLPAPAPAQRVVIADVVAINQPLVYNRFGSTNPWGMIYALRDQVQGCERISPDSDKVRDPSKCAPGKAMLKANVRPRPMVLRVNQGDQLVIRFQNLLKPTPPGQRKLDREAVGNVAIPDTLDRPQVMGEPAAESETPHAALTDPRTIPHPPDDPATRLAGISVVGLKTLNGQDPRATGLEGIGPGQGATYTYVAEKPGSYFFASQSAVQGGEGDGGSLTHGLFGMVVVEPQGAKIYRSQVNAEDMACLRNQGDKGAACENQSGAGTLNYDATRSGVPIAAMHKTRPDGSLQIIHADLTAIVVPQRAANSAPCVPSATDTADGKMSDWRRPKSCPYREFSIIFHDELKTVHAPAYAILNGPAVADPANASDDEWKIAQARHRQMVGTRDGFAINYGASGMGTTLISNRAGVGPARDCVDCAYEEFFLQSWANGDPALLPQYRDDPSNVYHSYLGDPVEFHNVHAGPKETHVFHLHAHQWLSQEGKSAANYLDSQTIGPFQSFTYQIEYGGSGNRNLGPGDSIFHCHLYPHFAQGMWGLWRTHDVFEDGTRLLPDGGGLEDATNDLKVWQGTGTDPLTGTTNLQHHPNGTVTGGTPIPGLLPLPGMPLAPAPTYAFNGMPGFPFYIPGKPGFRAPQAPLDIARDGGLPRHVTGPGVRTAQNEMMSNSQGFTGDKIAAATALLNKGLDNNDLTFHIDSVQITLLPQNGTDLEKAAMAFHGQKATAGGFRLNGRPAKPGSPFANPCPASAPVVRYNASIIETNLLVNRYGWHDPQARINVLDADLGRFEWATQRSQRTPRAADPFFFRVHSGDCVEFQHTNRTAASTGKDQFQVAAPTDIIGQHIHLVKFDVTASDGSANGFNYEDGTLSSDIIAELIEASSPEHGGAAKWVDGRTAALSIPARNEDRYQATLQRWWADPRRDADGKDHTLGTVFTHDHFAPSNIQQHGFYNALIVEPAGSKWLRPDGSRLNKLDKHGTGAAVGTQAIIQTGPEANAPEYLAGNRREFVLAVADFALLYDGSGPMADHRIGDHKLLAHLTDTFVAQGRPIAPPGKVNTAPATTAGTQLRAEAISVDHHDPFLLNYRNEPMPVRMGDYGQRWTQYSDPRGDAAFAFSSATHRLNGGARSDILDRLNDHGKPAKPERWRYNRADGDPSTEIFEAYVGDKAIIRMIQGAQEVQHVFEINGMSWHRQPGIPASPRVASQEIGISEHFELDVDAPLTGQRYHPTNPVDFLYSAGTVDAKWNGAWGLLRTYPWREGALDPAGADYWTARTEQQDMADKKLKHRRVACRLASVDGKIHKKCGSSGSYRFANNSSSVKAPNGVVQNNAGMDGLIPDLTAASGMSEIRLRKFCLQVVKGNIEYNRRENIFDPNGVRYVAVGGGDDTTDHATTVTSVADLRRAIDALKCQTPPAQGDRPKPLVLRMNAGDFAVVDLRMPEVSGGLQADGSGNSRLPPIVPSSSAGTAEGNVISDHTVADRLDPSNHVSIVPQLVAYNVRTESGAPVGQNDDRSGAFNGFAMGTLNPASPTTVWFAGTFATNRDANPPEDFRAFTPFKTDFGMVAALSSSADVIKHASMGLVGALVIEPEGATWTVDPHDPTLATVTMPGKVPYREAVLIYQDGLNLKTQPKSHARPSGTPQPGEGASDTVSIPDCHVCGDTYDSGDSAVNYRTEPFWARLNAPWRAEANNFETDGQQLFDLNSIEFPRDIWTRPVGGKGSGANVESQIINVPEGSRLVIHAVHPGGRARQRALVTFGHSYDDMSLARFGSPSSALLAPRKAVTAVIDKVERGCWLWRDGPAQFVGGGAWGLIESYTADAPAGTGGACPIDD